MIRAASSWAGMSATIREDPSPPWSVTVRCYAGASFAVAAVTGVSQRDGRNGPDSRGGSGERQAVPVLRDARRMDVIGARFANLPAAIAARDAICAAVAVPASDVAVRPLGTTRYDEPVDAFVLAGKFPTALAEAVVRLMRDGGGTILSRRTEWLRHARPVGHPEQPQPQGARPGAPRAMSRARKRLRRPAARLRIRRARCCSPRGGLRSP